MGSISMNKELIIKYKAEFDHWLAGGQLRYTTNYHNDFHWNPWSLGDDDEAGMWSAVDIDCIVINDEYVEFRKALAESKKLQFYDKYKWDTETWDDLNYTNPSFAFSPDLQYRVKPGPTFQVGDWIETITGDFIKWKEDYVPHKYDTLWSPQPGELCVFWDDESRYTIVAPFDQFGAGGMPYAKGITSYYDNVAPVVFDLNIYKG